MRHLILATSILASVQPALAQTQTASEPAAEEIIVTARRVAENLQDAPASISVFTDAAIQAAGIRTATDFVALTPGVTIVTGTAEVGDTQINIRGLNGARDAEPSVALVVDGILKTNTASLNQAQGDLTQIEVLKGPQGAYYGRNAAAGALVVQTRKPGDRLEGRFLESAAEDKTYAAFASVSGPLTPNLGLLLSGEYRTTDGFYRNTGPIAAARGATVDYLDSWNVGGRLVARAGEATEIDAKVRVASTRAAAITFNAAFALKNFAGINPAFYEDVNQHPFLFQSNIVPRNVQNSEEASVKLTHDFAGGGALTGYVAYSNIRQDLTADGTSAAFGFFNADASCRQTVAALNASGFRLPPPQTLGQVPDSNLFVPNGSLLGPYSPTTCDGTQYQKRTQRDVSAELRYASDAAASVRWQVGGYYLNIRRQVGVNLGIDRGFGVIRELYVTDPRNPTEQLVNDRFRTNVYAVFGSVDADLVDRLKASVALRYDSEHRRVTNLVPVGARTQYVDYDGVPFTGGAPLNPGLLAGPIQPKSATFNQLQPKLSLTYEPSRELTLYANWGIGFKAGGFNNQGSRATIDLNFNGPLGANLNIDDQYRKERSSAFEAGFKASAFDGRLAVQGAGYYTRVKDMQFFEFYVGTFGLLRVVSNIDKVDLWGGELSADLKLTDWWRLSASANVTDSEIKANSARRDTVGNKSPYTADYTLNVGTSVAAPLSDRATLNLRADLRVTGPTWFSTVQAQDRPTLFTAILPLAGLPAALGTGNYALTRRDSFAILNLRAGITFDGLSVTAFATNVTNKRWLAEVIPAPEFGGSFISPGDRQRFGVEVGYRF